MNKNLLNILYIKGTKWWLTGILLFLPFQFRTVKSIKLWNNFLGSSLDKIEEITIIVFLLLAIIQYFIKRDRNNNKYLILSIPFFVFLASGLISGIVGENSFLITVHGTFDYLKYFLVVFIYASFFKDFTELKKVFRLLLMMAVFFGTVAFIQEIWALISRYILEKDIADHGMKYFGGASSESWRLGFLRTRSLMSHYNILGLYSLLILGIYLSMVKKVNFIIFLSLFAGVFVSVSRMIYSAALLIAGSQIFRRRWSILLVHIPVAIMLFYMSAFPDFDISKLIEDQAANSVDEISITDLAEDRNSGLNEIPYRKLAREKGLEVWKDHPLWGVGPGMFGSAVAYKYRSPVYEEYNFTIVLRKISSLDQFWPQVLAETGVIGAAAFAGLLITLFISFAISARESTINEMRGFFIGLMMFMMVLIIYSLGGTFNHSEILFTYGALAGMGLGCEESETTSH